MGLRISSEFPPGMIGITSSTMGRYREFDVSLNDVRVPKMTLYRWSIGLNIAENLNKLCRIFLADSNLAWLWILGDDHTFKANTLMELLGRKVDVIAPLCYKRTPPFNPVMYVMKGEDHFQVNHNYLKGKRGIIPIDAVGNAGMLIRREVIEEIGEDWHRTGWLVPDQGSSDLYFCKKAREHGYTIYVDLDNPIGHINHMAVWPQRNMNNEYSVGIGQALEFPDEAEMPLADMSEFINKPAVTNEEMAAQLCGRGK